MERSLLLAAIKAHHILPTLPPRHDLLHPPSPSHASHNKQPITPRPYSQDRTPFRLPHNPYLLLLLLPRATQTIPPLHS